METLLWLLLILTRAVDHLQTRWIFSEAGRAAGFYEANRLLHSPVQTWLGLAVVVVFALFFPQYERPIVAAAAAVSAAIVWRNHRMGIKMDWGWLP